MLAHARRSRKKFVVPLAIGATLALSGCGASGADVSPEGQIDYACALIDDVKEKRTAPDDWGTPIGDDADPAIIQAASAAALAGAMTGGGSESSAAMGEAAMDVLQSVSRAQMESMQEGVDAFAQACSDR
ncbi:MAG TPA: hypothetical protein VK096_03630 [Actinomycetales bacterium]|nr:hypothetical protein [Actinomycetales bacterium]